MGTYKGFVISDIHVGAMPVEKLYSFTVSDEVLKELKMIMKEYMAFYVHHEFKSLQIFG